MEQGESKVSKDHQLIVEVPLTNFISSSFENQTQSSLFAQSFFKELGEASPDKTVTIKRWNWINVIQHMSCTGKIAASTELETGLQGATVWKWKEEKDQVHVLSQDGLEKKRGEGEERKTVSWVEKTWSLCIQCMESHQCNF